MHRLAPLLHVLGPVILIFSFTMRAPLVTALVVHAAAQHAFDEFFAALVTSR
jgi:hypothetical protein